MDKILKYLGIIWSIIAFVFTVVFFLGGEWHQWKSIKEHHINGHAAGVNLSDLGKGEIFTPSDGTRISELCKEGQTMVGIKYHVADGDNAGALYSGLWPVCRNLR